MDILTPLLLAANPRLPYNVAAAKSNSVKLGLAYAVPINFKVHCAATRMTSA
jgi:hypothetical protein